MERMQRRWNHLTEQEVQEIFDRARPEDYAHGGLGGGPYMLPFSDALNGKELVLRFEDAPEIRYHFHEAHSLTMTDDSGSYTDWCDIHEAEPGLFFVHHAMKQTAPPRFQTAVLDLKKGLVTVVQARIGNEAEPREVSRRFLFGRIEGCGDGTEPLHHFTSDLVGKAIWWIYHEQGFPPLKHIYSTEYYYSYVMNTGDKCWMASNPADYVKINDHQYLFSFLEERQTGVQGLFLINMDSLHDVGCFSGINGEDRFESYTVGARGELTTMETYLRPED